MKRRIFILLLSLIVAMMGLVACSNSGYTSYDAYNNPLVDTDVGGSDTLMISEDDSAITMENENVRIVFHAVNGSIKEYVNKETKQYLVKDAEPSEPFTVAYQERTVESGTFRFNIAQNTTEQKEIEFIWTIGEQTEIIAHARLAKEDDTVCFDVEIKGNISDDYIVSVEYPVFSGIKAMCEGRTDQFVSPIASGFLFDNPAENFNREDLKFKGVTKSLGMYPQGFFYPMQFMAYITENIGGFYIGTNDGGCTVKSFTFCGDGEGSLRAGIHHFVDDIAQTDTSFDYEVQVSNLTKGYWQEAGDLYFSFAKDQEWTEKGRLENREDIDKTLFEDTVLVNFGINGNGVGTTQDSVSAYVAEKRDYLYTLMKEKISGKFLNIYQPAWMIGSTFSDKQNGDWETIFPGNVDEQFKEKVLNYGDRFILFEYNTLFNANYRLFSPINEFWKEKAIQKVSGDLSLFTWTTEVDIREWWYICPSCQEWTEFCNQKEAEILTVYGSNGLYHDVGTGALAPLQCYDTTHPHGTNVNVIDEYIALEREAKELACKYGQYSDGQEMIYEQLIPYVDFYQARANGGLISFMEGGRFHEGIREGITEKIPLFDYVYHAYGALRTDGFMLPIETVGDGYYHAMAFTVLNGGLPEYNFEFFNLATIADNAYLPYLEFIDELGKARTEYGKEFLVYGDMRKAPTVSKETVTYDFLNQNVSDGASVLEGTATYERVISSAFEYDGKIGIFLINIAEDDMTSKFILEAGRFYGVENGEVKIYNAENDTYSKLAEIENGEAKCSVKLPSREVVMLVIDCSK